jgi:hypothetical protein
VVVISIVIDRRCRRRTADIDCLATISADQFADHQYLFAPYGDRISANDIVSVSLASLKFFRIEHKDFCHGELCLTIIVNVCQNPICPSTTVFVGRKYSPDRLIAPYFGKTLLVVFPLSKERIVTVIHNGTFVAVAHGFGQPEN